MAELTVPEIDAKLETLAAEVDRYENLRKELTRESPACPHRWKWSELGRHFAVLIEARQWLRAASLVEEAKKFAFAHDAQLDPFANLEEPLSYVLDSSDVVNKLEAAGCVLVRDLMGRSRSQVFELPGMGLLKINYLTLKMSKLGLKWPVK